MPTRPRRLATLHPKVQRSTYHRRHASFLILLFRSSLHVSFHPPPFPFPSHSHLPPFVRFLVSQNGPFYDEVHGVYHNFYQDHLAEPQVKEGLVEIRKKFVHFYRVSARGH